jgi:hypothetical protein
MLPLLIAYINVFNIYFQTNDWGALSRVSCCFFSLVLGFILTTETMAEHRAKSLSVRLPIALSTGFAEIDPQPEPLKVP